MVRSDCDHRLQVQVECARRLQRSRARGVRRVSATVVIFPPHLTAWSLSPVEQCVALVTDSSRPMATPLCCVERELCMREPRP